MLYCSIERAKEQFKRQETRNSGGGGVDDDDDDDAPNDIIPTMRTEDKNNVSHNKTLMFIGMDNLSTACR